jgi:hypothetical protein
VVQLTGPSVISPVSVAVAELARLNIGRSVAMMNVIHAAFVMN